MCGSTIIGLVTPLLIKHSLFHFVGTLTISTILALIESTQDGNNFSNSHTVLPIRVFPYKLTLGAFLITLVQISGVECTIIVL